MVCTTQSALFYLQLEEKCGCHGATANAPLTEIDLRRSVRPEKLTCWVTKLWRKRLVVLSLQPEDFVARPAACQCP
jgi:hypothetical protein